MGFAECLGVIISMRDKSAFEDAQYERWLRQNTRQPCFDQVIPRATSLQTAAHFCPRPRSYWAKYPGETGKALRQLAAELIVRTLPRRHASRIARGVLPNKERRHSAGLFPVIPAKGSQRAIPGEPGSSRRLGTWFWIPESLRRGVGFGDDTRDTPSADGWRA